jgi:hypothetical protein
VASRRCRSSRRDRVPCTRATSSVPALDRVGAAVAGAPLRRDDARAHEDAKRPHVRLACITVTWADRAGRGTGRPRNGGGSGGTGSGRAAGWSISRSGAAQRRRDRGTATRAPVAEERAARARRGRRVRAAGHDALGLRGGADVPPGFRGRRARARGRAKPGCASGPLRKGMTRPAAVECDPRTRRFPRGPQSDQSSAITPPDRASTLAADRDARLSRFRAYRCGAPYESRLRRDVDDASVAP